MKKFLAVYMGTAAAIGTWKAMDEEKRKEHEIQKLHDEYIEAIEVAGKAKEEQLREV